MSWYQSKYMYNNYKDKSGYKNKALINIGGAISSAKVSQENVETDKCSDINQTNTGNAYASAMVSNFILINISSSTPGVYTLNNAGKDINIEVDDNGEVILNGEKMDIKELGDGTRVMYLQSVQSSKEHASGSEPSQTQ